MKKFLTITLPILAALCCIANILLAMSNPNMWLGLLSTIPTTIIALAAALGYSRLTTPAQLPQDAVKAEPKAYDRAA